MSESRWPRRKSYLILMQGTRGMGLSAQDLKRGRLGAGEVQTTVGLLGVQKDRGAGHEWLPKEVISRYGKI